MAEQIRIMSAEMDDVDCLIVTFTDWTTAGYVVEELLDMRSIRESVKQFGKQNPLQDWATHH